MRQSETSTADVVTALAREPLRNIVLLKHLEAYPDHTRLHHVSDGAANATLVLLETAASAYDREAYPATRYAALISSDAPVLTTRLLDHIPDGVAVVFKIAGDADGAAIAARFVIRQTAEFWSFTSPALFNGDAEVVLTRSPGNAAFDLFAAQGHAREWLAPLLAGDRAFACTIGPTETPLAVCFAYENYQDVWEIGGVVTPPQFRGRGFAARVVRTALAELSHRRRTPRYQVDRNNTPSIRLAESVGLQRFLVITHFLHLPLADTSAARAQ